MPRGLGGEAWRREAPERPGVGQAVVATPLRKPAAGIPTDSAPADAGGGHAALEGRQRLMHIQRSLREALGADVLADLHREKPWLDWTVLAAVFGLVVVNAAVLAHLASPFRPLPFIAMFVFQGVVLHMLALLNHDLFVHRRFAGRRIGRIVSLATTTLLLIPNTGYEKAHRGHHVHIGSDEDPENYKQDIDSFWKRLLFLTFPGMVLATSGRFRDPRRDRYMGVDGKDAEAYRRARQEAWITRGFLIALVVAAALYPYPVLFGYFVPALVMVPILNTLRILLEHADVDASNPYSIGTFYRTGPVSQVVFLWSSGDCHVVHHIFPNIPFYNFPKALKKIVPLLVERGLVERTSFWSLLRGWFVDLYGHRSHWKTAR